MKALDTIQDFFTQVMVLVNQIRFYGQNLINQKIVEDILRYFPPNFDLVNE